MGISNISGRRLVTKRNTVGELVVGSASLTTPGGGTFTSWIELTSATAAEYVVTAVQVYATVQVTSIWLPLLLEVGIGGSGSETALTRRSLLPGGAASGGANYAAATVTPNTPWRITSGTRLTVRMSASNNTGNTGWNIEMYGIPWASLEGN